MTCPPRKTTLEDRTIWSGDALTRSPVCSTSSAALAEEMGRSVAWPVAASIARTNTVAASWSAATWSAAGLSGLLAATGALTRAATRLVRVLRTVLVAGSAQASVNVMVDPTVAPAMAREAVVLLTRSASAPGAMTRATVLPVSWSFMSVGATMEANLSRADVPAVAASSSVRSWALSARRAVACSVTRVPMSSFNGPAPRTIPTASAIKIETMETRW